MEEFCWLRHVHGKVLVDCTFDGSLNISWSAFHADRESEKDILPALKAILPLFEEQLKQP